MVLDDFQGPLGFCYFCGYLHSQAEDLHSSSQRTTSKDSVILHYTLYQVLSCMLYRQSCRGQPTEDISFFQKVSLEQLGIYLCIVYEWLKATIAEFRNWNQGSLTCIAWSISCLTFCRVKKKKNKNKKLLTREYELIHLIFLQKSCGTRIIVIYIYIYEQESLVFDLRGYIFASIKAVPQT
jgi:hypothetical protein